jgi:hypothetical protein
MSPFIRTNGLRWRRIELACSMIASGVTLLFTLGAFECVWYDRALDRLLEAKYEKSRR